MNKKIIVDPKTLISPGMNGNKSKKQRQRQKEGSSNTTAKNDVNIKKLKKKVFDKIKEYKERKKTEVDSAPTNMKPISTNSLKNRRFEPEFKEAYSILTRATNQNKTRKKANKQLLLENSNKDMKYVLDERPFEETTDTPNLSIPSSALPYLKSDPKHGCLRVGGDKPTYSTVNKTRKRPNIYIPNSPVQSIETIGDIDEQMKEKTIQRQKRLETMKELRKEELKQIDEPISRVKNTSLSSRDQQNIRNEVMEYTQSNMKVNTNAVHSDTDNTIHIKTPNDNNNNNISSQTTPTTVSPPPASSTSTSSTLSSTSSPLSFEIVPKPKIKTQKNKKIYVLGKGKNGGADSETGTDGDKRINVLISNNKTRKKKEIEIDNLMKIDPFKKRQYLMKGGFIKKGSSAPDYVINEMYKNAILSGDLKNTNNENLLYNVFGKTKSDLNM